MAVFGMATIVTCSNGRRREAPFGERKSNVIRKLTKARWSRLRNPVGVIALSGSARSRDVPITQELHKQDDSHVANVNSARTRNSGNLMARSKEALPNISLDHLREMMRDNGVVQLLVKELAPNDNAKTSSISVAVWMSQT